MVKKIFYPYLLTVWLVLCGCSGFFTPPDMPKVVDGVLDLSDWSIVEKGPVNLKGQWNFEWQNGAKPGQVQKSIPNRRSVFINVPGSWNGHQINGKTLSGSGYAVYRLKIVLGELPEMAAFKFLDISSAARIYVNGKMIYDAGVVGQTAAETKPEYKPKVVHYHPSQKVLEVVAFVSNFNHRLGGMWEPIYFGTYQDLNRAAVNGLAWSLFLMGGILIMAFYYLALYLIRPQNITPLYFSLFSFLLALRGVTTGERVLLHFYPDFNWNILQRLVYLSFYLAAPVFALYVHKLFPAEISGRLVRLYGAISAVFSFLVLVLSPRLFSYSMPVYQICTLAIFIYGIYGVMRAILNKRQGAVIFMLGFMVLFAATLNDILYSREIINSRYIVPFGLFIFIFFQSVLMSLRFSRAFTTVEVQGRKLKKTIEAYVAEIANRKKIEEDLRQSRAKYEQLLQSVPAGIYELDLVRFCFTSVNRFLCEMTGYSEKEFLALAPLKLLDEDAKELLTHFRQQVKDGIETPDPFQVKVIAKNGQRFWSQIHTRNYFENGIPVMARAVALDITALKRAESAKEALEEKLRQAQKLESIGTLAGGIAHDFNNLLMGIQGNASLLLLDEILDQEQQNQLKAIESLTHRGVQLTAQLLGLARGGKYDPKTTNPNTLVENCVKLFARTRKEVAVKFDFSAEVKAIHVDRGQIEQVLLNLLINAWQAMQNGGDITIATRNVSLDDDFVKPYQKEAGPFVMISVADTGSGMDEETKRRVFDPFFTTKEMGRGTGLGLASAYGIIENHGGIINLESTLGVGSRFNIYLPAVDALVKEEASVKDLLVTGKARILLIDDERMIVDIGKRMLVKLGYDVLTAGSGKEALELYQAQSDTTDMVILDMVMPGQSGSEVYDRLKALNPDVKVLLASGYSLDGEAREIMARGCNGFIQKPFSLAPLSQKINQILSAPDGVDSQKASSGS